MGFNLNLLVFLGVRKERERERERFQGRRCGLDAGLGGGPCYFKAVPGGWRGTLEETP